MIAPQNIHHGIELGSAEPAELVLESLLATTYLLQPEVTFWNTSNEDITIQLNFELDLGVGVDDLSNGSFDVELLASTVIGANEKIKLPLFQAANLINRQETPTMQHTLTMTYTAGVSDPDSVIARLLVCGYYDESLRDSVLTFRSS